MREAYLAVGLALLVCLAGCGMPTGPDDVLGSNGGTVATDSAPTGDDSQSAGDDTATRTVGGGGPAFAGSPTGFLPYSSELPVSGYLRTDEAAGERGVGGSGGDGSVDASAGRTFERTDSATESGPAVVDARVVLYDSPTAAADALSSLVADSRANDSAVAYRETPVDAPVVTVETVEDGQAVTRAMAQYGEAVVVVTARTDSDSYFSGFTRGAVDVTLVKLASSG
ncbi:hypothetical protein [Salinirubrum litoreum]|uniref:Uncharacterized protein n=1 Tax=Salinirubrum litoreum TaxID=1126234 RepID=A0ABD5RFX6_9EURY|nr:hypothetical protein [Salinirubrum litoreum]